MSGLNIERHFCITQSKDVQELCLPALKELDISYFTYVKIFPDGSRDLLTTHPDWTTYFYQHALYHSPAVIEVDYLLPNGNFLWVGLNYRDSVYQKAKTLFQIDNGITLVVKKPDATRLYFFGATPDNKAINRFYRQHLDLLNRFIFFFHDKGKTLLDRAASHRIVLPNKQTISTQTLQQFETNQKKRNAFLEKTEFTRFFLVDHLHDLYLTPQQVHCLYYLSKGHSVKQTAKRLNVSNRTVETHILTVKDKLACANKEALINQLICSQVMTMIFEVLDREC